MIFDFEVLSFAGEFWMAIADVKQMFARFVTGRERVYQEFDEVAFVTPPSVTFDNIRRNRFRRSAQLTSCLVHLVTWQTQ